jgi:hypothetical protein
MLILVNAMPASNATTAVTARTRSRAIRVVGPPRDRPARLRRDQRGGDATRSSGRNTWAHLAREAGRGNRERTSRLRGRLELVHVRRSCPSVTIGAATAASRSDPAFRTCRTPRARSARRWFRARAACGLTCAATVPRRTSALVGLGFKVPIHVQARSYHSRSASVSSKSSLGTDESPRIVRPSWTTGPLSYCDRNSASDSAERPTAIVPSASRKLNMWPLRDVYGFFAPLTSPLPDASTTAR